MSVLPRPSYAAMVERQIRGHPVVRLLGGRQACKTTLARLITESHDEPVRWFDLEDLAAQARVGGLSAIAWHRAGPC